MRRSFTSRTHREPHIPLCALHPFFTCLFAQVRVLLEALLAGPMLPSTFQIDLPFCMLSCYTTCRIDPVSSEIAGIYDILS